MSQQKKVSKVTMDTPSHSSSLMAQDADSLTTPRNFVTSSEDIKQQPTTTLSVEVSDELDVNYQRNIQRGLELKSQEEFRESQSALYEQKQKELEMQMEQKRKEMEMQMEMQRKPLELSRTTAPTERNRASTTT